MKESDSVNKWTCIQSVFDLRETHPQTAGEGAGLVLRQFLLV